jgi:tRNA 2-thiocytidine biosynthesis protein TtcA
MDYNKNYNKWFLTKVKRAIRHFSMLDENEKVAVGVSGGKDSSTLLFIMNLLHKKSHFKFDLTAIALDLGLGVDFTPLERFCDRLQVELYIVPTLISQIVFDIRNEKNPCSLCSKLRGGALYDKAKQLGCTAVALGHHGDDAAETLLLNMMFTGKLGAFKPTTYLDRRGIKLIRPLVYLDERTIQSIVKAGDIPVLHNPCSANGKTNRERAKEIIDSMEKVFPNVRQNILTSLSNVDLAGLWLDKKK